MRIRNTIAWVSGAVSLAATIAVADKNNRYEALHTDIAPVIDGVIDKTWDKAPWDSIPYTYIGTKPTANDFSGRYKVMWDSSRVYILVEVVDDSISDVHADPLVNWWDDDCVEVFLDENKNGGDHQYNFSAWAYHISTKYEVVDYGTDQKPHLFNDHFQVKRVQTGRKSIWELSMLVYGENYTLAGPNTPLKLTKNKEMGFTLAYCDNDGKATRDNFMGSVNTPGHMNNEGYMNASCFGALKLLGDSSAPVKNSVRSSMSTKNDLLQCGPEGFRFSADQSVAVRSLDGALVDSFHARPGVWYGGAYADGLYAVVAQGASGTTSHEFRRLR